MKIVTFEVKVSKKNMMLMFVTLNKLISDDFLEKCIDGLCYCKEGGMLVQTKIEIDKVAILI